MRETSTETIKLRSFSIDQAISRSMRQFINISLKKCYFLLIGIFSEIENTLHENGHFSLRTSDSARRSLPTVRIARGHKGKSGQLKNQSEQTKYIYHVIN